MSLMRRWGELSLSEFTCGYAPCAGGVAAALFAAERTNMLSLYRAVYTSWVSAALLALAVPLYLWAGPSMRRRNLWLVFWTGAHASFLVHMSYALGMKYNAADRLLLPGGPAITVAYYVLAAWWLIDVLLAWLKSDLRASWVEVERTALHVALGVALALFAWQAGTDMVLRVASVALGVGASVALAARLDRARGVARELAISV